MKLDEEILKGRQYIDKLSREYIENHTRSQERENRDIYVFPCVLAGANHYCVLKK